MIDAACKAGKIGLCVVPVQQGTKKAKVSWAKYQSERPTEAEIREIFTETDWLAILCGPSSGNLEAVDFDSLSAYPEWVKLMEEYAPELLAKLLIQSTPSGGRHVLYRCETIQGNQKLANSDDGSVAIETRGIGGYILAAPTTGYRVEQGKFKDIPTITRDERDLILALCRSLTVKPVESFQYERNPGVSPGISRPGDIYNQKTQWDEILTGWTKGKTTRDGRTQWARPGKRISEGIGATTGNGEGDLLFVFTSNAPPFNAGAMYSKFAAYTVLNHGGDFYHAAQVLSSQGYGKRPTTALPDNQTIRSYPGDIYGSSLSLKKFSRADFQYAKPVYLVEPYLVEGKCILLDADGGTGKSCLCAVWAAALTSGITPITGEEREPVNVLYLHRGEDSDEEITTVFAANGGDFERWFLFSDQSLQFDAQGLADLEKTIIENDIKLIVVDALFYFLSTLMENTYNALPAMAVMEKLNGIAERTRCVFWNIRHTKKGSPDTKASDLGMGSVQFRNSHRGQLMLRFHPDEPGVIVCTDEKGSLLVRKGKPFCYRREDLEIMYLPDMGNPFAAKKVDTKVSECKKWLWETLGYGAHLRKAIIERGAEFGFSQSLIYEAAKELDISKRNQAPNGPGQPAIWWAKGGCDWSIFFDDEEVQN